MGLRERSWFPVLYMFVITVVLSAVIILFGRITSERVENNARIAFERAVLQALSAELPPRAGPVQIHEMYLAKIQEADESSTGALRYVDDDSLRAYALPLDGPGFWAPIRGVVGIEPDKRTITGIAFYEQNETPGLGGEIVGPEFRQQFVGKKIALTGPAIKVLPQTAELDESSVHAITGATQTSTRLGEFMNEQIGAWRDAMEARR